MQDLPALFLLFPLDYRENQLFRFFYSHAIIPVNKKAVSIPQDTYRLFGFLYNIMYNQPRKMPCGRSLHSRGSGTKEPQNPPRTR